MKFIGWVMGDRRIEFLVVDLVWEIGFSVLQMGFLCGFAGIAGRGLEEGKCPQVRWRGCRLVANEKLRGEQRRTTTKLHRYRGSLLYSFLPRVRQSESD